MGIFGRARIGFHEMKDSRCGAGQIEIVHKLKRLHASVSGAMFPIENDVVPDIQTPCKPATTIQAARQTPVSSGAVSDEVVMKTPDIA